MNLLSIRYVISLTVLLVLALGIGFIWENYADFQREQASLYDYGIVRWNETSYIPNLEVDYSCTIPAWIERWLTDEQADVFYRVTTLDFGVATANPDDLEQCLAFQHVTTVHLDMVVEEKRVVELLEKFPRLRKITLGRNTGMFAQTPIEDLIKKNLPHVQIDSENW